MQIAPHLTLQQRKNHCGNTKLPINASFKFFASNDILVVLQCN